MKLLYRKPLILGIFRRHLDGRAWKNDPDVFLLRDQNNKYLFDW